MLPAGQQGPRYPRDVAAAEVLEIPGPDGESRRVRLSSPDKVMWPATEAGPAITKRGLADYVVAVGDRLLDAIGDRPVTLQRFRDGITGGEFYSKNPPRGVPEWARTEMCTYPSGRSHPQLVVDEVATALWCVQMSTITWHPWPVRTGDNDRPDELRIDLDPQPGRGFGDVVEAAHALREVMTGIGLTPFVKTSGNRGVHVFARIASTREFLDVRHGVIGIARELERRLPDLAGWPGHGQGVQVDDAEDGVGLVLYLGPAKRCSQQVAQVQRTGRLDAGEHPRAGGFGVGGAVRGRRGGGDHAVDATGPAAGGVKGFLAPQQPHSGPFWAPRMRFEPRAPAV